MRPGLNCMMNCFVFGDSINRWQIELVFQKHTELCIHSPVNARASILFLSATDGSLFAWLLSLFEWSWRRTRVWILHYWQRIHLLLAFWRASKHLLQSWMERQVIRNRFDLCWKQPGWTLLPIWMLQRQTDLKPNGNMIIQKWINLLPLDTK